MATATIDTSTNMTVNLAPENQYEEIIQNIATLLSTAKYSVPLDRGFGLSQEFLDKPVSIAKTIMISDMMDAIETYEPRVTVEAITFTQDEESPEQLVPVVEVSFDE